MTEAEWLAEQRQPQRMIRHLRFGVGRYPISDVPKKLRRLACGCGRLIWDRLTDARLQQSVEFAERFADGEPLNGDLQELFRTLRELTLGDYAPTAPGVRERTAAHVAVCCTVTDVWTAAMNLCAPPLPLAGYSHAGKDGWAVLCTVVRDIFRNPFRPAPALDPTVRTWNGGTIPRLARAIHDARDYGRVGVLADALEDAGCEQADLLAHLRGGPHVRGCWALDLLLGRG
jgi:hypothetical protein